MRRDERDMLAVGPGVMLAVVTVRVSGPSSTSGDVHGTREPGGPLRSNLHCAGYSCVCTQASGGKALEVLGGLQDLSSGSEDDSPLGPALGP